MGTKKFYWNGRFIAICFKLLLLFQSSDGAQYLGKSLGKLGEFHHGVSGEVFAVDGRTLHIKDFTYDGQGPAAYFWAGSTKSVGNQGFRIRDENNSGDVLRRYRKEGVTLTLPEGKTLRDIKWFSVWCEEFEVNFGDVKIPRNFDFPRPQKLAGLQGVHGISSDNIVVVDAQTLLVPNLSYDGEAPDAKFWTGPGPNPSPQGIRIPDENGKEVPLRRYDRKTVVLTLPGDLTIFDIGHFGIWCEAFTVDFGHIKIPQNLNIPPSLKMLGVSPQKSPSHPILSITQSPARTSSHHFAGGHLEATTYRPQQHVHFTNNHQHSLVQRKIVQQKDGKNIEREQQIVQQQLIPQQVISQQIISQHLIPQRVIPQQVIPQQVIPLQVIPQRVIPQQQIISQQQINPQQLITTQQLITPQQLITRQQQITPQQQIIPQQQTNSQQQITTQQQITSQQQINPQQQIIPSQIVSLQSIPQQVFHQNHFFHQQPQQVLLQQQPVYQVSDRIDQYQVSIRRPVPYTPFNIVQPNQFGANDNENNKGNKFQNQNHYFG